MTLPGFSPAAAAGLLGTAAWLGALLSVPPEGRLAGEPRGASVAQERPFGSAVPCAVPLRWRVGRVDPGFRLAPAEAGAAIGAAEALWEEALERELFTRDTLAGFPVHFDYDDRQAAVDVRSRLEREVEDVDRTLDGRRARVEALQAEARAVWDEYEERRRAYEQRVREHNARVQAWNERGGAPGEVRHALRMADSLLAAERRSLEDREGAIRALQDGLQGRVLELNEEIRERNRRLRALAEASPTTPMEAGRYQESIRTLDGRMDSIRREIRVFQFADRAELVAVLAHEMGHALGLGHSPVSGAIMSAVSVAPKGAEGAPRIHADDVERLLDLCPGLGDPGDLRR